MVKGNGTNELNEILRTITDLVSFKTTENNFPEFEKAVAYVEKFFEGENVFIRKHYYNNIPALFITVNDTNKPHILLQGHLDVVNGGDEQFQPKIVGDKLYGRGTVDMKGFVALAMHALRKAAREGNDVGLMITFDEEIGSENGTKRLVEEEGYSCDILFNGDGGYNYAVIYGEKGILKFELEVEAEPGRHPYPWDGENAFDLFIEDYRRITKLFPESKYATDADNWHTTYSIYDVKVYNDEFYPPRKVTAKMNIYFSDDITTDELCRKIKAEMKHVKIKGFTASERVFINPASPYVRKLHEIMERNFGREIIYKTENGSSDARFYANKGLPIVIVKMVGEDHHGANEHILISEIIPMYKSVNDFIREFSMREANLKKETANNEA